MSYLNDFLFSPERANSPVRTLSGGERNRVLLARLFALPANVLVLDEPTNDLDIDTLELLEDLLQAMPARSSWSATTGASSTTWSPAPSPGKGDCQPRPPRPVARVRRRLRGLAGSSASAPGAGRPATPRPAARKPAPPLPPPAPGRRAPSSATRSSASSTRCRRASRRWRPSRRDHARRLADSAMYAKDAAAGRLQARHARHRRGLLAALERWEALGAADRRPRARQDVLLNQPSLVAAGWVRLTISPDCRYSALSSRMARVRSKPGQLGDLAQVAGLAAHAGDAGGQRPAASSRPG
jgi:ATP-binding cassette subfamily F protein uup